ncbi:MAG: peptidoglycan DD-metalloendopeptidase family protein [Firmicutes bacterium]|nr:peptidoglycan DD-metalloendopeptidase family protein [Bacillota bacterium]
MRGKRGRAWLGVLLALVLVMGAPAAPAHAGGSLLDQIRQAQQRLEELKRQIQEKQRQLQQNRNQAKSLLREIDQLDQQLTATQKKLDDLNRQLQQTEAELQKTTRDLQQAEAELQRRQGLVNDRLVAMYKAGSVSYIEVLLSSKSFSDFVERWELLRRIAENDARLMRQTQALRDAIAAKKERITEQKNQIAALKAQVAATKATLQSQVAARQSKVAQLNRDAEAYRQALDELEASSKQVTQLLQHLQSEFQRQRTGFGMAYPLEGGPYRVTSPFGRRWHPILHEYRMHDGVDLAAPYGTKILAAEDGRVVYAGWMAGYGNATVIDHGVVNGKSIATLYGHQSAIYVHAGQIVHRGDAIGAVGSTGQSTGPHLHFEVRVNGVPVDPAGYVNLR